MSAWTQGESNDVSFLCVVGRVCVCSNDLSGALEATMECQSRYKQLPRLHEIIVRLVGKGDTELLQKGDAPVDDWKRKFSICCCL